MLDRSTPVPLYFQLAEILKTGISQGLYAPGGRLPSEHELCDRYAVSRSVVRQALQALALQGLIATERGRGAFVRERKVPIRLSQRLDPLQQDLARAGFALSTRVLAQQLIEAPPEIAGHIGDTKAIMIERLRYADGEVLLLVRNYLPFSRVPGLLSYRGLEDISLYDCLEREFGIVVSTGQRIVEIGTADAAIAGHLGLEAGSRVLFNRELTYDQDGRPVEYYESWHHPDRTRLTIDLHRAR